MEKHEITRLLSDWRQGDSAAAERLITLVYGELRGLAAARLAAEGPGHTLQPTALVHEVLVRLLDGPPPAFENRRHFFGAAARAMRQILVDHARRKRADKRGGELKRVELDEAAALPLPQLAGLDVLGLEDALRRLEALEPTHARIVDLRVFLGLTIDETAGALELHPSAVNRGWAAARAWLIKELHG